MTRISVHVCLLFILGCWASSSNGTTISLEDKLNQLEFKFDAEVYQLKVKNNQLEAQLELNVSLRALISYSTRVHLFLCLYLIRILNLLIFLKLESNKK